MRLAHVDLRTLLLVAGGAGLAAPAAHAAPQLWSHQPRTPAVDTFTALASDGAGGVYCAGTSSGDLFATSLGGSDAVLAHYDAAGQLLSGAHYGSSAGDSARGLAPDGAGGVFIAGETGGNFGSTASGVGPGYVARIDATGALLWAHQFGLGATVSVVGVATDGVGGCFVAIECSGAAWGAWQGMKDIGLARLDAAGNLLWSKQFGSSSVDNAYFVRFDGQGGAIVGGATSGDLGGPASGAVDAWYADFDAFGAQVWSRKFGTASTDRLRDVQLDGAGGLILAGETWGEMVVGMQKGQADLFLSRVDGSGSVLWTQQHGTGDRDEPRALAVDPSGSMFVCGQTLGFWGTPFGGADVPDLWVGKFAPDGSSPVIFQEGYEFSPLFDSADALLATGSGGVFAAGLVSGPVFDPNAPVGPVYDAWVARYDPCDFESATNFCTALPNSIGKTAAISHLGSRSLSKNDFVLKVKDCPLNQLGIFILGTSQASMPFGNGNLCLGGTILRLLPAVTVGPAAEATLAVDFADPLSSASQITAGSTWNFQFWYRDPAAGGASFNLSNGLSATFCP